MATDFELEVRKGRLILARIRALPSPAAAVEYALTLRETSARLSALSPILCADHRLVAVYSQEVSDELARLFARMNQVLVRIAVVAAHSNATLIMQLGRIIREAGNPNRKLFTDAQRATTFLDEILDPSERVEIRRFLGPG
jgi:hypothetical protein